MLKLKCPKSGFRFSKVVRELVRGRDEGKKLTLIWESKAFKATQPLSSQKSEVVKAIILHPLCSTISHFFYNFYHNHRIWVNFWHSSLSNTHFWSKSHEEGRMKSICRLFLRNHFQLLRRIAFEILWWWAFENLRRQKLKPSKSEPSLTFVEPHIYIRIQIWIQIKF